MNNDNLTKAPLESPLVPYWPCMGAVQAVEGEPLPPMHEGETIPITNVELHQVKAACMHACALKERTLSCANDGLYMHQTFPPHRMQVHATSNSCL